MLNNSDLLLKDHPLQKIILMRIIQEKKSLKKKVLGHLVSIKIKANKHKIQESDASEEKITKRERKTQCREMINTLNLQGGLTKLSNTP